MISLFRGVQPNLVFHPRLNVVALMTEVKILDRVLQILTTKLQGTNTQTLKRWKLPMQVRWNQRKSFWLLTGHNISVQSFSWYKSQVFHQHRTDESFSFISPLCDVKSYNSKYISHLPLIYHTGKNIRQRPNNSGEICKRNFISNSTVRPTVYSNP